MLAAVQLSNGKFGLGQVARVKEDDEGNVIHTIWAFFNVQVDQISELTPIIERPQFLETPFLICGMDYEELEKGKWPVVGNKPVNFSNVSLSDELIKKLQREEIAGAYLLQMYLGIVPWNMYKDPEYLDKRLLPGYKRPDNAFFK